jgi:hypothetical protein
MEQYRLFSDIDMDTKEKIYYVKLGMFEIDYSVDTGNLKIYVNIPHQIGMTNNNVINVNNPIYIESVPVVNINTEPDGSLKIKSLNTENDGLTTSGIVETNLDVYYEMQEKIQFILEQYTESLDKLNDYFSSINYKPSKLNDTDVEG